MQIRTLSLDGGVSFSFALSLSITTTGEAHVVCSSSFTMIPSSPICLSYSSAGSRRPTGIFLGGWTAGGSEGSLSKSTLLDILPAGGVVV